MAGSIIRLAGSEIEIASWGVTTLYPDGLSVPAAPQDDATYRARAEALGYGADTMCMCVDHEVAHAVLAHVLGLRHSPTLRGVAEGAYWPHWQAEEASVLGLQRYARMSDVDLVKVAQRLAG
ncbi:hypothetical protein [Antarcticirhabdus aurantiaca]|uniref:Uncharacterized protein n=1 Tax=Antarcticirhabdus aurantiaca TaxID=2606717 RepID=A0ACD4NLP3_9HYPH|nr:hypothetical protein OXU80_22345 [Jeongeuplla avenae]